MKTNETLRLLLEDCSRHMFVYMQNMNPEHVSEMLKKAFEAGKEEGREEVFRIMGER